MPLTINYPNSDHNYIILISPEIIPMAAVC